MWPNQKFLCHTKKLVKSGSLPLKTWQIKEITIKYKEKLWILLQKPGEIKSFTTHGKIKNFNGRHGKMTSPNKEFLDWQTQKFYCKRKGKNQKLPQKV